MATRPDTESSTSIYRTRQTCRGCDKKTLTSVLDLGCQYLPRFVETGPERLPKAPLHLVRCAHCGLLQLNETVEPDLLYREFWYRSSINATMRDALADLVRSARAYRSSGRWLDIGANDGYLLRRVPDHFHKVACEPAINFKEELEEHADEVVLDYFSADSVSGTYDVITSVAMFYDLNEPGPFLDHIHRSLARGGIWINQLNDAPTMMKAHAFDAICHEHLCYYDVPTLANLYAKHGLTVVKITFNTVNGGSIRVIAQRAEDALTPADLMGIPAVTMERANAFAARTRRWKTTLQDLLGGMNEKPWGYGASTKGSTLLQYLEAEHALGPIADRNSLKKGKRLVGIWPITDENEFRRERPRYALVLPWAFREEFDHREEQTREAGTTFVYPLPEVTFVP